MNRKTQTIIGIIALVLAIAAGLGAYWFLDAFAATAVIAVPAQAIPAGALITPGLLEEREVPRALLDEPIYATAADLYGKVAQVPLAAGMAVYRHHAVPLRDYRLVDDPTLVVVSVPLSPDRAVGGQVQPGHRVDVWLLPRPRTVTAQETLPLSATLILTDALVVDVRASQGQAVSRQPQAVPGQLSATNEAQNQQQAASNVPLQIMTFALPLTQTTVLLDAVAQAENGVAILWAALAPLTRPVTAVSPAVGSMTTASVVIPLETKPETTPVQPTTTTEPTPTPESTPAALANPQYRVTGTGGTLRLRETPRGAQVGSLKEGDLVLLLETQTVDGTPWYRVTTGTDATALTGWASSAYLEQVIP